MAEPYQSPRLWQVFSSTISGDGSKLARISGLVALLMWLHLPSVEELVARADGTYGCEVERDFTRWENLGADGWRATRRDGSVFRLGTSAQSRQDRAPGETFRWMIESLEDTNGNRVEYDYLKDAGQIYLSEIRYGLHATEPSQHFRLVFDYDDQRPDPLTDCCGRFRCETRLCQRTMPLFLGERRIRRLRFDYDSTRPLTQLARFTVFGDQRADLGVAHHFDIGWRFQTDVEYFRVGPRVVSWPRRRPGRGFFPRNSLRSGKFQKTGHGVKASASRFQEAKSGERGAGSGLGGGAWGGRWVGD